MRRKRIHNYLKRCRREKGLTQNDVAYILGLQSSSLVSRWEKGVSLPETLNALKMAAIYDTTVDYLYEDARLDMLDELSRRAGTLIKTGVEQYD
jgi:transcriptional regulator with XRE-family HTH domain